MNGIDRQVRDLFERAVGDPPRRVTLEAVRRRVVRRRGFEVAAASTAAVVVVAGLGIAVSAHTSGPPAGAAAAAAAHPPRYYIQRQFADRAYGATQVRSTATGAVTGHVTCPWGILGFGRPIVPAGHQTFFMACQQLAGTGAAAKPTATRIYRFHLTGSGRAVGYQPVPGGSLGDDTVGGIAVSADGSELAVPLAPHGWPVSRPWPRIKMISTRTGASALWNNPVIGPDSKRFSLGELSLTADGHELAFTTNGQCPAGGHHCKTSGWQVRAVSPAAAGGDLSSSRLLVKQSALTGESAGFVNDAVITPDASAVTIVVVHSGTKPRADNVTVLLASATTGKVTALLLRLHTGNGFLYRYFSPDASGRHLLLNAGPTSASVNGWIDHGQLLRLTPADGTNVAFEAW